LLEAALLHEVEHGGEEAEKERGVGGEDERDVEEDPDASVDGEAGLPLAGVKRGNQAEDEDDRQDEDAERDGAVAPVDEQKGGGEDEGEQHLDLMGFNRQAMVGGVEHLGQRDEVEEEGRDGDRDGEVTPAGAVVERCREDGERGNAVEEDRDSEPEEGHRVRFVRIHCGESSVYRVWGAGE